MRPSMRVEWLGLVGLGLCLLGKGGGWQRRLQHVQHHRRPQLCLVLLLLVLLLLVLLLGLNVAGSAVCSEATPFVASIVPPVPIPLG